MAGFLEGKVVAVTGGGRGIGRAVALAAGAEGAKVLVADFGVGMAGQGPTSEVADAVGRDRTSGGEAIALGDDSQRSSPGSTCLDRGRALGTHRRRGHRGRHSSRADAVQHVGRRVGRCRGHPPQGPLHPVPGCIGGHAQAGRWWGACRLHLRRVRRIVAQANYAAAKGGIVSLVRSAAVGLHRYGVTANAIAPVARTRMSANVPSELAEMGDPEDVAPWWCTSSATRRSTSPVRCTRSSARRSWCGTSRPRSGHVGRRPLDSRADRRAPRQHGGSGADGDDRPLGADAPGGGVGREAERLVR